jgi:hypothetical protein
MKENTATFAYNPITSIVLGILAVIIVYTVLTGRTLPLITGERSGMIALVIIGMAMCARGIGLVAANNDWIHPIAILGYLLGALILVIAGAILFGYKIPIITDARMAIIAITILGGAKLVTTIIYQTLT